MYTSKIDLELRKKLVKCYIWSIALYGAETRTLRAVNQKQVESFEMWCWRRMKKISWTDHVRNEEVLLRDKKQRNILHEISKRKSIWIGKILHKNCLLQQVIEGKIKGAIEVEGKLRRRHRKLLDDLTERRGYSHLKEEALDRTLWRCVCVCVYWINRFVLIAQPTCCHDGNNSPGKFCFLQIAMQCHINQASRVLLPKGSYRQLSMRMCLDLFNDVFLTSVAIK
jgi:hypothetical protein